MPPDLQPVAVDASQARHLPRLRWLRWQERKHLEDQPAKVNMARLSTRPFLDEEAAGRVGLGWPLRSPENHAGPVADVAANTSASANGHAMQFLLDVLPEALRGKS